MPASERQDLRETRDRLGEPLGQPLIAIQPRDLLDGRPTPRTLQPRLREDEPDIMRHERQIADAALIELRGQVWLP